MLYPHLTSKPWDLSLSSDHLAETMTKALQLAAQESTGHRHSEPEMACRGQDPASVLRLSTRPMFLPTRLRWRLRHGSRRRAPDLPHPCPTTDGEVAEAAAKIRKAVKRHLVRWGPTTEEQLAIAEPDLFQPQKPVLAACSALGATLRRPSSQISGSCDIIPHRPVGVESMETKIPDKTSLLSIVLLFTLLSCTGGQESATESDALDSRSWGKADIYGEDDREDPYRLDENDSLAAFSTLAQSVAIVIKKPSSNIVTDASSPNLARLKTRSPSLCAGERFTDELAANGGGGTAFLVGPNLMATAGHVFETSERQYPMSKAVVFGFGASDEVSRIQASDVYRVNRLLAWAFNYTEDTKVDYALFELSSMVEDRKILPVRESGEIEDKKELVILGHPANLPLKIASGHVLDTSPADFFLSNLDTSPGFSGSPVINQATRTVEGIHVRGYSTWNQDQWCTSNATHPEEGDRRYNGAVEQRIGVLSNVIRNWNDGVAKYHVLQGSRQWFPESQWSINPLSDDLEAQVFFGDEGWILHADIVVQIAHVESETMEWELAHGGEVVELLPVEWDDESSCQGCVRHGTVHGPLPSLEGLRASGDWTLRLTSRVHGREGSSEILGWAIHLIVELPSFRAPQ